MTETLDPALASRYCAVSAIVPGKNPRRKKPTPEQFADMVASMQKHGVIEPLIVRPTLAPETFEIVCGATRLAAAAEAGLAEVPVVIRDYTDVDVLEIQLIENIQRHAMHPLDEGEGFKQLMALDPSYTIDTIAQKVGKSRRWVFQRLAFVNLAPKVKEAFGTDAITVSHAELLSRLEPKQQEQALKDLCFEELWDEAGGDNKRVKELVSTRDLEGSIQRTFRLAIESPVVEELLPEIADAKATAEATGAKVLQLATVWLHPDVVKKNPGVLSNDRWKPAGGKESCPLKEQGVVVLGGGTGRVLDVCINRECPKHWPKPKVERTEASTVGKREEEKRQKAHKAFVAKQQREQAARAGLEKLEEAATPVLRKAVATGKKLPAAVLAVALDWVINVSGMVTLKELRAALGRDPVKALDRAIVMLWLLENDGELHFEEKQFRSVATALGVNLKSFAPKPAPAKGVTDPKDLKTVKQQIDRRHGKKVAKKPATRKAGKKR